MNIEDVETVEDCVEAAIIDAYGEYEQATGWLTCLQDIFSNVKEVNLLGEAVTLTKLDLVDNVVVAICAKKRHKAKVTFDSIQLLKPTSEQELWHKAWKSWVAR